MKSFTAGPNDAGARLSRFVLNVTQNLPSSVLYKGFRNKRIKVNGKRAQADYRLTEGDVVELYLNDEFFPQAPAKKSPAPRTKQPALTVIYEDDQIAVLYKPSHLLCHSDRTGDANLVDAFIARQIERGEYDPNGENAFSPAICNRLDRGTEGLVVAAKTAAALREMNRIIRDNEVHKEYLTITCGVPPKGRHTAWLRHDERTNKVTVRPAAAEGYKEIITQVSVERTVGPFALCRIGLITGRTHQIRAHLAFLGAPVLGDIKYGSKKMNERTGLRTQALCAVRLTFAQLPETSCLAALSGAVIELPAPAILVQFEQLANGAKPTSGSDTHKPRRQAPHRPARKPAGTAGDE